MAELGRRALRSFCSACLALCLVLQCANAKPNVLILYADDLGYGDLGCYNPASKIPTPSLDELAREGMLFSDGHSSSGICTPSRYALLTGRYHWRKFHKIVNAFGSSVFAEERLTLPEMLQQRGYTTACIGKWHLGWDWGAVRLPDAEPTLEKRGRREVRVWGHDDFDWTKPIPDGPLDHGFDYYFGDAVINFPPYTWIEGNLVVDAPDGPLQIGKQAKEGSWEARPGPAYSGWDFYENLPVLADRAVEWLGPPQRSSEPFFLYFAFPSPHAPIVPTDKFDGASEAGPYGDYVVQTDAVCGRLLQALEDAGVADNTIVVLTSDNGPEQYAYPRDEKYGHWSAEPLRGLKRDIYEGGHRVPFIVRWPGEVEAGSTCDALVSQIDLMATLASIVGFDLPGDAAEDSHDMLPLLRGGPGERTAHVHNTYADMFAMRSGSWVLVDAPSGYSSRRRGDWEARHGYEPEAAAAKLFDLEHDLGQRKDLAADHPDKVRELRGLLNGLREQGFSVPRLTAGRGPDSGR